MKRYIIVGWDKKEKKMKYLSEEGYFEDGIIFAQIFTEDYSYNLLLTDNKNIERLYKMEVHFGKVEEV